MPNRELEEICNISKEVSGKSQGHKSRFGVGGGELQVTTIKDLLSHATSIPRPQMTWRSTGAAIWQRNLYGTM